MPLMKRKSEKAFKHNIEAEMDAGKPQKQALAIAYSVKRRAKKAAGGGVKQEIPHEASQKRDRVPNAYADGGDISAHDEKRPMPENLYADSAEAKRNSAKKELKDSDWTDQPTLKQARKGLKTQPIKQPKMVPSNALSRRLYDQEGNLLEAVAPASDKEQPAKWMDEEDAKKMGSDPDMENEHSTHRKPYAKGGQIEESDMRHNMQSADMELEDDVHEHGIQRKLRSEELDMQSELDPSEDEGSSMAHMDNEEMPNRHGNDVPDMDMPHNKYQRNAYKDGGDIRTSHPKLDVSQEAQDAINSEIDENRKQEVYIPDEQSKPLDHPIYNAEPSNFDDGGEVEKPLYDVSGYDKDSWAEGGEIEHEMMDQPEDEAMDEHESSIAAAIMSKRRMEREDGMSGSRDMDEAENYVYGGTVHMDKDGQVYAKGGMAGERHGKINSHGSFDTHEDEDQADVSRNADESANEEDQMSFRSLMKENYSESEGLDQMDSPMDSNLHGDDEEADAENEHDQDMVSKIRKQMRMRSPIAR